MARCGYVRGHSHCHSIHLLRGDSLSQKKIFLFFSSVMELGARWAPICHGTCNEPESRLPVRTPPFFAHFTDFTLGTCTPALASMLTANFQNGLHARARRTIACNQRKKFEKVFRHNPPASPRDLPGEVASHPKKEELVTLCPPALFSFVRHSTTLCVAQYGTP